MMNELIEKSILDVLRYFSFFNYPSNLEEIHTFLKKRCSRRRLVGILEKMVKKTVVKSWKLDVRRVKLDNDVRNEKKTNSTQKIPLHASIIQPLTSHLSFQYSDSTNASRYTLHQYGKHIKYQKTNIKNYLKRSQISQNKVKRIQTYIKLLAFFPQIKLIGLSGSVAMLNADENHDVDLFIVTAKNGLWTGRFIALFLAQLLGIRRKRHSGKRVERARPESKQRFWSCFAPQNDSKDKVCLNLFFDESALAVPKYKRSEYVAHEVLQMKPLVQKDSIYMRFIDANRWVFDIFPNARSVFSIKYKVSSIKNQNSAFPILNTKYLILNTISDKIEQILKNIQLKLINRHRTSEIVTSSQLWFHPEDFEKKIKGRL